MKPEEWKRDNVFRHIRKLIGRYGGEEFLAILPETDSSAAYLLAEGMCDNIESLKIPHVVKNNNSVTISIGVATIVPQISSEMGDLIKSADNALYEAKFNGRNQVKKATVIF